MAQTYDQQLDEVQAAISKVLVGQSYTMGGRTLTRANLADLEKRETRLLVLVNRQNNGGLTFRRSVISMSDR